MANYQAPGVYIDRVESGSKPIQGVGTAVAAFVGFTERAPEDPKDPHGLRPRLVTNWSQFVDQYGGFTDDALLPHAVRGFFDNGGGAAYIVRVPRDGAAEPTPELAIPAAGNGEVESLRVRALKPGEKVEVQIDTPKTDDEDDAGTFTVKVKVNGRVAETYKDLSFSGDVASTVNAKSKHVMVDAPPLAGVSVADRVPKVGTLPVPAAPAETPAGPAGFEGDDADRTGIRGLTIAEDVTMVLVPDLATAARTNGSFDLELFESVQRTLVDYCDRAGNRMAILDAPPDLSAQDVKEWRERVGYDSPFAVLYYPWIEIANPASNGNGDARVMVPPSGHVAGIWGRTDDTRGVWKAPANEVVRGVLDLETQTTQGEQELLNPIGVNCIRSFGTRGIRIWGARTQASDASWRYVSTRRLFNFVEESILQGTQWVVFEPNDLDLWQRVKRTVNAFLTGLWRQGALFGATPEQAFYVKCDEETNPPESRDEGRLVVEVGLAPVKPAEFVVFRISQLMGDESPA